jgi:fatty acid desaturase
VSNFWNLPRLRALLSPEKARAIAINGVVLAVLYATLVAVVGPLNLALAIGPGLVLSLMMLDPIMMSQHTHVPLQLANGEPVAAIGARDQAVFTRSLRFPRWFSASILLHFDAHELHHMYPFVPGYRLGSIDYEPGNHFHWWTWISTVRRMPADVFLFSNRNDTGADV